jgi:hypothetical protein
LQEDGFFVYGSYCANHRTASELILANVETLTVSVMTTRTHLTLQFPAMLMEPRLDLPSFLIKPIQRICRYPLLMRELVKFSDETQAGELECALAATERVAQMVNEIRRKEENDQTAANLEKAVDDWKVRFVYVMKFNCKGIPHARVWRIATRCTSDYESSRRRTRNAHVSIPTHPYLLQRIEKGQETRNQLSSQVVKLHVVVIWALSAQGRHSDRRD